MLYSEQLSFLETIAPQDARYKAVASIGADAVFMQEFHLSRDVPTVLSRVCASDQNAYLSLCDYIQPRRAGELVFGFTAFGFDIDCHASKDPASDAMRLYRHLQDNLFGTKDFPAPSMVEHTGRGLLVIIAFERTPKQVLPLWLRMGEGLGERIRAALPAYATLDNTYSDAARVVRVPDSFNTKAGIRSRLLDFSNEYPVYKLSVLRDVYFPHLHPSHYGKKRKEKGSPDPRLLFTDSAIKLHVDRLQDLIKLCEMRKYRVNGMREKILFLYRYWTCFYIGPQAALEAALDLNRRFSTPLAVSEATGATRSAEEAFQRWRVDRRSGYNYRNTTLIDMLGITPAEQKKLCTIISKEEKAQRRADKQQWGHETRDHKRHTMQESRKQRIAECLANGMTRDQICKKLHCSPKKITALLKGEEQSRLF